MRACQHRLDMACRDRRGIRAVFSLLNALRDIRHVVERDDEIKYEQDRNDNRRNAHQCVDALLVLTDLCRLFPCVHSRNPRYIPCCFFPF